MPRLTLAATAALVASVVPALATGQPAAPAGPQPYGVGNPLGVTRPAPTGPAGR